MYRLLDLLLLSENQLEISYKKKKKNSLLVRLMLTEQKSKCKICTTVFSSGSFHIWKEKTADIPCCK